MTGRDLSAHRLGRAVRLAVVGLTACFAIVFFAAPGSRESLLIEDGPLESTTAAIFGVALIVGIWAMAHAAHAPRLFWIVPAFALLALLDETGFGSRIFGFTMPEVDGMTVDSLHDVFDLADHALARSGIGRTAAAMALLLGALGLLGALRATGRWPRLVAWARARPPMLYLSGAVSFLLLAVVMDLVGSSHWARFIEESLEMVAAGLVILAGIAVAETPVTVRIEAP